MKNRFSILLAVFALIVIVLGAYLTSEIRPLPGSSAPTAGTPPATGSTAEIGSAPSLEEAHRIAGYVVVAATLGLAIWISNLAGWLALATVVLETFLGGMPVMHALLAPVFFALVVTMALTTSNAWRAGPIPVGNQWGPLRAVGTAIPILLIVQIGLGAAFRHNAMGVVSHIMNAFIVLLVVLVGGVFVLRQYPEHPSLRPAALALLIVTGIQVLLGFSVYLALLMSSANNAGLVITSVLHVANGALTLAAGVVLAIQMQRNIASRV